MRTAVPQLTMTSVCGLEYQIQFGIEILPCIIILLRIPPFHRISDIRDMLWEMRFRARFGSSTSDEFPPKSGFCKPLATLREVCVVVSGWALINLVICPERLTRQTSAFGGESDTGGR